MSRLRVSLLIPAPSWTLRAKADWQVMSLRLK